MEDIKVKLIKKLEVEYIIKCTFLLSYIILYNKKLNTKFITITFIYNHYITHFYIIDI